MYYAHGQLSRDKDMHVNVTKKVAPPSTEILETPQHTVIPLITRYTNLEIGKLYSVNRDCRPLQSNRDHPTWLGWGLGHAPPPPGHQ